MVFIAGASCITNLKNSCGEKTRKQLETILYSRHELSVNSNTKNPTKTVQYLFKNNFVLKKRNKIIIWHDVFNNSITEHRSDYCSIIKIHRLLTPDQLVATLKKLNINNRIIAIVYTRRGAFLSICLSNCAKRAF